MCEYAAFSKKNRSGEEWPFAPSFQRNISYTGVLPLFNTSLRLCSDLRLVDEGGYVSGCVSVCISSVLQSIAVSGEVHFWGCLPVRQLKVVAITLLEKVGTQSTAAMPLHTATLSKQPISYLRKWAWNADCYRDERSIRRTDSDNYRSMNVVYRYRCNEDCGET